MRWNWPTVEAIFGSLLPVIRQETDDSYNPIRHWRVPEIEGCKPAAGQVALVKFAQFLSHNLERQHLSLFQLSLKRRSKCLQGTRCNRMPLLDPGLNGADVMRIVLDDHPDQGLAPFPMPPTVFVKRINV